MLALWQTLAANCCFLCLHECIAAGHGCCKMGMAAFCTVLHGWKEFKPPAAGHGVLQDGDGRPPAQFYMAERNSNDLLQVMEYCNMGSLGDAVSQGLFHNRKAPQPENLDLLAVLRSGAEIASALCYLHDGEITHGDLSGGLAGADWIARAAPEFLCTCQCRLKSMPYGVFILVLVEAWPSYYPGELL